MKVFRRGQRASSHEELTAQYVEAGFTQEQGELLADKILDRRKPWRREVLLAGVLAILFSSLISFSTNASIGDIQDSRLQACEDTNDRHDETIAQLKLLIDAAVAQDPEREDQIRQSQQFTILLIDRLVPVRDCEEFVK